MSGHAGACPARDPRVVGNCKNVCCQCICGYDDLDYSDKEAGE